jgi:hypothetical protein
VDEGDHQIAHGGQNVGRRSRAQAGAIFGKGDIAHVVEPVLYTPAAPREGQQALWAGLLGERVVIT